MRDMVFVSHANPEDNDFSRWLALRLAGAGYGVWCDLTKLLGGERFWEDIEQAIRERTAKFLCVLSRASNDKPSVRDELHVALAVRRQLGLKDFVIPVWIDATLPPAEFNIELTSLNAIPFHKGWAPGLADLLQKLQEEGVPRHPGFGPAAVSTWWQAHASATAGIRQEPERLISNCYPIEPCELQFHELTRSEIGPIEVPDDLPYPAARHEQYLVAFAPGGDFTGHLGPQISIARTTTRRLESVVAQGGPRFWSYSAERSVLTQLLKQAWGGLVTARGLPTYEFAGGARAFYFTKDLVPSDRITFPGQDGHSTWRQVVGYKTISKRDGGTAAVRYWHFGLQAKPTVWPVVGYVMKPHVLFSDDGRTIWTDPKRLHRARRGQCRGWWNDKWRDLIAATVWWIANGKDTIELPVGGGVTLRVAASPVSVTSPISFEEPATASPVEEPLDTAEAEASDDEDDLTDTDETDDEGLTE